MKILHIKTKEVDNTGFPVGYAVILYPNHFNLNNDEDLYGYTDSLKEVVIMHKIFSTREVGLVEKITPEEFKNKWEGD